MEKINVELEIIVNSFTFANKIWNILVLKEGTLEWFDDKLPVLISINLQTIQQFNDVWTLITESKVQLEHFMPSRGPCHHTA